MLGELYDPGMELGCACKLWSNNDDQYAALIINQEIAHAETS
jgi:hypothetical protein